MLTSLLVALAMLGPPETVRVDLLEVNHLYDRSASPRRLFVQLIAWDRAREDDLLHVVFWKILTSDQEHQPPMPYQAAAGPLWRFSWWEDGGFRTLVAPVLHVSVTQHDPEVDDRRTVPMGHRPRLFGRPAVVP